VIGAKPEPRITLTYPALESSREVAFLVAGAAKRTVLEQLLKGNPELPAAHLHPVHGTLHLFVDRAAAPRETR
jgi:6-phosphogluconolactonase